MKPGIDPKIDYAFKKVYGGAYSNVLLPSLINAVRQGVAQRQVATVEVRNPFNEKASADDKLSILDIRAVDDEGDWYNVEMQMVNVAGTVSRFLYYWAKTYSQQLTEGDEYTVLRPTVSICFVNDIVIKSTPGRYHTIFTLKSDEPIEVLTDDIEIHLIELPKFRKSLEMLMEPLDLWLYFLKNADGLDADSLPDKMDSGEIRQAMEVLKVIAQDTLEREIYEGRQRVELAERMKATAYRQQEEKMRRYEEKMRRYEEEKQRYEQEMQHLRDGYDEVSQSAKSALIQQIQFAERILGRESTDVAQLMSKSNDDLQGIADALRAQWGEGD